MGVQPVIPALLGLLLTIDEGSGDACARGNDLLLGQVWLWWDSMAIRRCIRDDCHVLTILRVNENHWEQCIENCTH
ncbi:hypothetical protein [Salinispora arenicola]|uniref:hypothetical protein n=1 Tax=Salinispora arenicola TaxID=168697 RepID=UPI0027DD39BC|nr:hypothetical protein [Salinispora arenicola]